MNSISPDGLTLDQQLTAVRDRAEQMLGIASCWREELLPAPHAAGFRSSTPVPTHRQWWSISAHHFSANVCPVLTPLAFDPGHPFPTSRIEAAAWRSLSKHEGATKFARVKVPDVLPRFVPVPETISGSQADRPLSTWKM